MALGRRAARQRLERAEGQSSDDRRGEQGPAKNRYGSLHGNLLAI